MTCRDPSVSTSHPHPTFPSSVGFAEASHSAHLLTCMLWILMVSWKIVYWLSHLSGVCLLHYTHKHTPKWTSYTLAFSIPTSLQLLLHALSKILTRFLFPFSYPLSFYRWVLFLWIWSELDGFSLPEATTMVSWEAGFSRETEPIPDTDSCPIHMPCALYGIGSFIYGSPKSFTQKTGDQENVIIQFQTFPEGGRSTGANRGALVWAYIQNQGDFKVSFQRQVDKGIGP